MQRWPKPQTQWVTRSQFYRTVLCVWAVVLVLILLGVLSFRAGRAGS